MRTKTIIDGFKNSQKFRFLLKATSGEEFGMTITVQQMAEQFTTRAARVAIWTVLERLAHERRMAKAYGDPIPTSLVRDAQGFQQVQVDLA